MEIKIEITENGNQLISELVNSIDEAKFLLMVFEYEYAAKQDAKDE